MSEITKMSEQELNKLLAEIYDELPENPYTEAELDELERLQYLQNNRFRLPHEI